MHFESLKVVPEHLIERIKLDELAFRDYRLGTNLCLEVPSLRFPQHHELHPSNLSTMNNTRPNMFLMSDNVQQNGANSPQIASKGCNFETANTFLRAGMFSGDKNFLSPRGHIPLTPQECGELFLKKISESNHIFGTEVSGINLGQHNIPVSHHPNDHNPVHSRPVGGGHIVLNSVSTSTSTGTSMSTGTSISTGTSMSTGASRPPSKSLPGASQTATGASQTPRIEKERPYSCTECGKTFLLKHHLMTHVRIHSGERPHVCPHCGKSFAHKHCLSTHLLLHTSHRPYECLHCKKSFTLKHHLVTHARVHTRERPFVCQECGRTFPQKRHLATHAKFHSGERPYVCEECGETFSQKDHLLIHSRFHGGQHSYVCSECGTAFARKFELVNHERLHGRVPHSCDVCGKEFLQKRTLLAHARLHTDADTRTFVCQQCGELFSTKEDLTEHFATHMQDNKAAFLCRNFPAVSPHFLCPQHPPPKVQMASASVQTDVVKKIKPHVCNDCGKCFSQKHGLMQHNKRHVNGGGCDVRSHVCNKCGKAFLQQNHLTLHSRQHMEPSESKSGLFAASGSTGHRSNKQSMPASAVSAPSLPTDMSGPGGMGMKCNRDLSGLGTIADTNLKI